MKKSCSVVSLLSLFLLISCIRNDNNKGSMNFIAPRIKRQIMDIAINYTKDQFKEAKKTVQDDGIIIIGNDQIKYIIDPTKILTGMIDDDSKEDAIVSITTYNGQFLLRIEHLILIKTDGKFKITKVLEDYMKIIKIQDKLIFAEISKVAPDAPSYNCALCKEVVRYRYRDGDIVRAE